MHWIIASLIPRFDLVNFIASRVVATEAYCLLHRVTWVVPVDQRRPEGEVSTGA